MIGQTQAALCRRVFPLGHRHKLGWGWIAPLRWDQVFCRPLGHRPSGAPGTQHIQTLSQSIELSTSPMGRPFEVAGMAREFVRMGGALRLLQAALGTEHRIE